MIFEAKWDSDFFNLEIGKVVIDKIDEEFFKKLLLAFSDSKYELLYLFENDAKNVFKNDSLRFSFNHVDTKVKFKKEIKNRLPVNFDSKVIAYNQGISDKEIYTLGIEAGFSSRFNIDDKFGKDRFVMMYMEWVKKSLSKELCNEVFCFLDNDKVIGFVTIKIVQSENTASIGLIAVDQNYRSSGIGAQLILTCENYCIENNVKYLTVETQNRNQGAMDFYLKNGFENIEQTNIYHLWKN